MGGVHGVQNVNKYLVNLYLPNGVNIAGIEVAEAQLRGADVLIGMNVIGLGDFAITNKNNRTVFTFRVPSIARYDFVKDHNASLRRERQRQPRSGKQK